MSISIAVVAAGEMGAAIGARLKSNGIEVLTSLANRSEPTLQRARASGMNDRSFEDLSRADLFLSVVPPDQATPIAEALANATRTTGCCPLYADLNAVSPRTTFAIAAIARSAGIAFTDGSIIGGPPREGDRGPSIYLSGEDDRVCVLLKSLNFDARHISAEIGAASALKMSYAGITKGATALGAAMLLGASRAGVADVLLAELGESQRQTLARLQMAIPDMLPKAHRWAPEMLEIADFLGEQRPETGIYRSVARFYQQLAEGGDTDKLASLIDVRAQTSEDPPLTD